MPRRGRDTYYLESMIAICNLAIGLLCLLVSSNGRDVTVLDLFRSMAPVGLWAAMWGTSGAYLMVGAMNGQSKYIRYAGLLSAGLWGTVSINAIRHPTSFPMTTSLAPVFFFYSAAIFVYQSFVTRGNRGRPVEGRGWPWSMEVGRRLSRQPWRRQDNLGDSQQAGRKKDEP